MFSLLYNLLLSVAALLALPKLLWQVKYRHSLKAKFGFNLPTFSPKSGQQVFWIHAVSMGETRAAIPLFRLLRKTYPDAAIVISTTTQTGQEEAKRSLPDANAHFFLPFDFSWNIRRLIKQIKPSMLILCESDVWYHLLKIAKRNNVQIALVNGKISERSCRRFQCVPFFARRLFSYFDILCVQNDLYQQRFHALGVPLEKLSITGNLKFETPVQLLDSSQRQALKASLSITDQDRVLVIGSTHAPEEDKLLAVLTPLWQTFPQLKILIVPRHPERFAEVAHLLQERGWAFRRLSENKPNDARLILIDEMGKLNTCYQIADLALVAGSFSPQIGGHNIFEPILCGVPVLFGPYMHNQIELKELILDAQAGLTVTLENLPSILQKLLENPTLHRKYAEAGERLAQSVPRAVERTFAALFTKKDCRLISSNINS